MSWSKTVSDLFAGANLPTGEECLAVVREIDPEATLDITHDSFEFHCAPEKAPGCLAALDAFLKRRATAAGLSSPVPSSPDAKLTVVGWDGTKRQRLTPPPEPEDADFAGQPDTMIRASGTTRLHRCECGGNVFKASRKTPSIFRCNSCGELYEGLSE